MRCEEIRSLLMTDYIDGQLDPGKETRVKEHLAGCSACRAFEESVRAITVTPFKEAKLVSPPERVWREIERRIAKKSASYSILEKLRDILDAIFVLPRMRVAVAAITAAVMIFALIGYQSYAKERSLEIYIEEEVSFLSQLTANGVEDKNDYLEIGNFFQGTAV
jgi:anti-sigma factor RsiW